MSGRVLGHILSHVVATCGEGADDDVLQAAGDERPIADVRDDGTWTNYAQFRRIAEAAAERLGGVDQLTRIHETVPTMSGSRSVAIDALRATGSPANLYASMGGRSPICPIVDFTHTPLGVDAHALTYRMRDGNEPFPELCAYLVGMNGMVPPMFGLRTTRAWEERCVHRGDDACEVRIAWRSMDGDDPSDLRATIDLLERSLDSLRATVAELVSDSDLESLLERIVVAAARTTWTKAFVLALDPLPWPTERVYVEGLDREEGRRIAAASDVGLDTGGGNTVLEVASNKRRYGRLIAVAAQNLSPLERTVLDAYTRLAASALDSAVALESARRESATSRELLRLSRSLAEIASTEEVAHNVARALTTIVGCDVSTVIIANRGVGRMVGSQGFDPETDTYLRSLPMPLPDGMEVDLFDRTPAEMPRAVGGALERAGVIRIIGVPVTIDGVVEAMVTVGVRDTPARLDPQDVEDRLRGLAGQVAVTLRNARLLDQVRHQARHDSLTGLPNRALLHEHAEAMLHRSRGTDVIPAALFIDLDGFKQINDTLGHAAGDEVLQIVADRLRAVTRESDTIGRLGGDEFVVLAQIVPGETQPERLAERILHALDAPIHLLGCGRTTTLTSSIGVAIGDRARARDLLHDADIALYEAKAGGRNRYAVFGAAGAPLTAGGTSIIVH